MRRQRHMAQMKEQIKTPEKEQNKMEISNLSDAEFKTLVIRMLKELIGFFNSIKKTHAEMKVTLSEIKKNLEVINPPLFSHAYKFFGYYISYMVLYIPMANL